MESNEINASNTLINSIRNLASAQSEPLDNQTNKRINIGLASAKELYTIGKEIEQTNYLHAHNQLVSFINNMQEVVVSSPPKTKDDFNNFFNALEQGKNAILDKRSLFGFNEQETASFDKIFNSGVENLTNYFKLGSKASLFRASEMVLKPALNNTTIEEMDAQLKDPKFVNSLISAYNGEDKVQNALLDFYTVRLNQRLTSNVLTLDDKLNFINNFNSIPLTEEVKNGMRAKVYQEASKNIVVSPNQLAQTSPETYNSLKQAGDFKLSLGALELKIQKEMNDAYKQNKPISGDLYLRNAYLQKYKASVARDPKGTLIEFNIPTINNNFTTNWGVGEFNRSILTTFNRFGFDGVSALSGAELENFETLSDMSKRTIVQDLSNDLINGSNNEYIFYDKIANQFNSKSSKNLFRLTFLTQNGSINYADWNNKDLSDVANTLSDVPINNSTSISNNVQNAIQKFYNRNNALTENDTSTWYYFGAKPDQYQLLKALQFSAVDNVDKQVILGAAMLHSGQAFIDKNNITDETLKNLIDSNDLTVIGYSLVAGDATAVKSNIFNYLSSQNEALDENTVYRYGILKRLGNGNYIYQDSKNGTITNFDINGKVIDNVGR